MSHLVCTINGEARSLDVPPMRRLLDVLRDDLRLTGAKEGCGEGECGSCSVLLNGELVNACLVPALQVQGATITTVEGLGSAQHLHVIQQCFLEHGGAQCGICTPGMMLATEHLLRRCSESASQQVSESADVREAAAAVPSDEQIREGLAGNLCRCTGYTRIFAAVRAAAAARGATDREAPAGSQAQAPA